MLVTARASCLEATAMVAARFSCHCPRCRLNSAALDSGCGADAGGGETVGVLKESTSISRHRSGREAQNCSINPAGELSLRWLFRNRLNTRWSRARVQAT